MTDILCGYAGHRDEMLMSFLYDDLDAAARAAFGAHLAACARCRSELSAFEHVRADLARWSPPEPAHLVADSSQPGGGRRAGASAWRAAWRTVPAWAGAAAALLVLGVAAGVANLDVQYGAAGLRVRTGWSQPEQMASPAAPAARTAPSPWRTDLAELEARLRRDLAGAGRAAPGAVPGPAAAVSPELMRRVRGLVDESERRQQRELALKVAEVMRDVNVQRQADLVRIDRSIGAISNNTGLEIMRQRSEMLNLVRTSLRQPPR